MCLLLNTPTNVESAFYIKYIQAWNVLPQRADKGHLNVLHI